MSNSTMVATTPKFAVSFNTEEYEVGGYEDGDTTDFIGDDLPSLIAHVCTCDENSTLTYKPSDDSLAHDTYFVGAFYNSDDELTAVLVRSSTTIIAA